MASHRRPKQPSRARVSVLTAAAATAVAIAAQAGSASAAPQPKKADVKAKVDKLHEEAEQAAEAFNGAKEKQQKLRKQAVQLQDQVARGQAEVTALRGTLGAVAAEQYRSGGIDPTVQLMLSSDPENYLARASSLEQVGTQQADALKRLQAQTRKLEQQKSEAASTLAELDRSTTDLKKNKATVQKRLAEAQRLLNSITAQERAAILADAQRASRGGGGRVDLSSLPDATGRAATAVAAVRSKLGVPYLWGGNGPNAFDCSGLMVWAYAKAGVSLPRTSQAQAGAGYSVPGLAAAQPGDLIIFHSDAHHVGMYIGNGLMIHAPRTGDVVKVAPADVMPIHSIRRVG